MGDQNSMRATRATRSALKRRATPEVVVVEEDVVVAVQAAPAMYLASPPLNPVAQVKHNAVLPVTQSVQEESHPVVRAAVHASPATSE